MIAYPVYRAPVRHTQSQRNRQILLPEPAMNASVGDAFDPERTVPNSETTAGVLRHGPARSVLVVAPCLRAAPKSPLPSEFERAVMDTAAHARCEEVLRMKCRRCAIAGTSLLAFAGVLALSLSIPWLGAIPAGLAVGVAWRWAVLSAAADELRAHAAR